MSTTYVSLCSFDKNHGASISEGIQNAYALAVNFFKFSNTDVEALITTGEGRFYSTGLDLDWLMSGGSQFDGNTANTFFPEWYKFLIRLLTFPIPTIAAINGKSFYFLPLVHVVSSQLLFKERLGCLS